MPKLTRGRIAIVLFMLGLGVVLVPRPAAASPTGLTLTLDSTGTSFTVIEGKSLTLNFTLTNNSGEELTISELDFTEGPIIGGDSFIDLAKISFTPSSASFATLFSDSSSNFSITFPTTSPTNPFEPTVFLPFSVSFGYCPVSDPQCTSADELTTGVDFLVIIQPASSATPEPSSLLLLATGLLGLSAAVRFAFRRGGL